MELTQERTLHSQSPVTPDLKEKIDEIKQRTGVDLLKGCSLESLQDPGEWEDYKRVQPRRARVLELLATGHTLEGSTATTSPSLKDSSLSINKVIESDAFRQFVKAQINMGEYLSYLQTGGREVSFKQHQAGVFEALTTFLETHQEKGWIKLPTGAGKTAIFLSLIEGWTGTFGSQKELQSQIDPDKKSRTLIVVPGKDLVQQTAQECEKFAGSVKPTMYYSDRKDLSGDVIVTTYDSLESLARVATEQGINFELVICDEAHRSLTAHRQNALEKIPGKVVTLAFTATPDFEDPDIETVTTVDGDASVELAKSVSSYFQHKIAEMTLVDAIRSEILCHVDCQLIPVPEESLQKMTFDKSGEMSAKDMKKLDIEFRHRKVMELMTEKHAGESFAVSDISVDSAKKLVRELNEGGISSCMIWGEIEKAEFPDILALHSTAAERNVILAIHARSEAARIGDTLKAADASALSEFNRQLEKELEGGLILSAPARVVIDVYRARLGKSQQRTADMDPGDKEELAKNTSYRAMLNRAQRDGEIQGRVFRDCGIEGWDSPRTTVLFNLRPTLSQVLSEQRLGRVLRQSPDTGKEKAIAYDFIPEDYKNGVMPLTAGHIVRKYLEELASKSEKSGVNDNRTTEPDKEDEEGATKDPQLAPAVDEEAARRAVKAAEILREIDTSTLAAQSIGLTVRKDQMASILEANCCMPLNRLLDSPVTVESGSKTVTASFSKILGSYLGIPDQAVREDPATHLKLAAARSLGKKLGEAFVRVRNQVNSIERWKQTRDGDHPRSRLEREVAMELRQSIGPSLTFEGFQQMRLNSYGSERVSALIMLKNQGIDSAAALTERFGSGSLAPDNEPEKSRRALSAISPLRVEYVRGLGQAAVDSVLTDVLDKKHSDPDQRQSFGSGQVQLSVREVITGLMHRNNVKPNDPVRRDAFFYAVARGANHTVYDNQHTRLQRVATDLKIGAYTA